MAARGTLIIGAFLVFVNLLAVIRGFLVAALLSPGDFGLWGLLVVLVYTLQWFRQAGIGEKFVQQTEEDQELEFQRAMTVELTLAMLFVALGALLLPLLVAITGVPRIYAPGFVLLLTLPATALQAPLWIYYRRMDFVRQRRLQTAEPLVGFVIAVGLALAGFGYWSLVLGVVAGAWTGAAVSIRASPHPIRWRFDPATFRRYARFSTPLLVSGLAGVVVGNSLVFAGEATVGLAGLGAITLAGTISQFSGRADSAVSSAMYPLICRSVERRDLLFEAFVKSNRLALIWGVPFGAGIALFAEDLVRFGLGSEWKSAVLLLQLTGVAAAVHQIGFNWDGFYRALDRTRPIALSAIVGIVVFLAVPLPLLITRGLDGLAWGILLAEAFNLGLRVLYLRRLFTTFRMSRHFARAVAPVVPASAVVVLARTLGFGSSALEASALVLVFLVTTALATIALERKLLAESWSYVRRRPAEPTLATT